MTSFERDIVSTLLEESGQDLRSPHEVDDQIWQASYGPPCVEEFMTAPLVTVTPDMAAAEAKAIADHEGVHHLVVVDRGKLVGVVCEYDLAQVKPIADVASCMVDTPFCVAPSVPLSEAAQVMREQAIGCLPVLEDDFLVGIVTRGDLRRAGLPGEEVAAPLCASCHGHRHVRQDPRSHGVAFCIDCLERAHPPEPDEDIGVGD